METWRLVPPADAVAVRRLLLTFAGIPSVRWEIWVLATVVRLTISLVKVTPQGLVDIDRCIATEQVLGEQLDDAFTGIGWRTRKSASRSSTTKSAFIG